MIIYVLAICLISSTGILIFAWDFTNETLCKWAIYVCLIFYLGSKVAMYLFLVERAHLIRCLPRARDMVFLLGTTIVLLGFGALITLAFLHPDTALSPLDGRCRIGLPPLFITPLLAYDVTINVVLTFLFIFFTRKYTRFLTWRQSFRMMSSVLPYRPLGRFTHDQEGMLKLMVAKSLLGNVAVVIPTITNLVILFKLHGFELGWLCFTMCIIDGMFPFSFSICPTIQIEGRMAN